jgi:aerobic C4-dicarboxylate transport protein
MLKKIVTHLTFYVLIAIVSGVLLGQFAPATAMKMEFLGTWFIALIKLFIAPIIFLTIVLGISSMGDLKRVGIIGLKSLVYFEIITTISLGIGVAVALILQPGNIDRSGLAIQDATKYTSKAGEPFSWGHFFSSNTTIQILLLAIVLGIVICYLPMRTTIVRRLDYISKWVFKLLKYVMYLAPLGAFGGMAFTIGKFGLATIIPLGKLMGCMYLTMALFIFVILGGVLRLAKLSIMKFISFIQEEILVVLGTSSSETAMPGLMYKLEKLGCKKSVVGLVVPTGYSFNLDGTSIYLSMAAIFLAQLYRVPLSYSELALLVGILMLTSKGAAGVTGSGFIVLASTLASMHTIPLEGLAFLLGVDKFMSEARAITNIIGNGVATLVIAKNENDLDMEQAKVIAI